MLHFCFVNLHLAYVFFFLCLQKFLPASYFFFKPLFGEGQFFSLQSSASFHDGESRCLLQELHQWTCKSKGEVRRCNDATMPCHQLFRQNESIQITWSRYRTSILNRFIFVKHKEFVRSNNLQVKFEIT